MKDADPPTSQPAPFERFTRALLAVPPKELERERAKYERQGDHRHKQTHTARRGSKPTPSR